MQDDVKKRLRTINIAGTVGIALLLAGTAAVGVMPLWQSGVESIRKSAELKADLAQLDAISQKIIIVQEEEKTREARLAEVEARLPTSDAMNRFVPDLAKVAEAAGLQVDHVGPSGDVKDAGDYKAMSVQVSAKGDWDTCYQFLTGLKGPDRKLTRLDTLTLQVDRDKNRDRPLCAISVDISTLMPR